MSVANLTHMTMVNLNNKVGSRIMENPLELEEESLLTLVLLVLLTVEGGASPLVAPLVAPLIAPLMAVAPAATSLVSSDVLSFASIASSGSLVIRFTVVGHVLVTVVVVDDDDDECLMGNNVDRGNCCRCRDLVVVVENCGAPNPEAVVASKPRSAVVDSMRRMINYLMCYFYLLQIYIYIVFLVRGALLSVLLSCWCYLFDNSIIILL
mmetsp:Transcript_11437/g.20680  ORF Transcript_11437/g.20680 Transcript_11437/m.20680 type:complete len:209 (-) Transcript_11437:28-654(-)